MCCSCSERLWDVVVQCVVIVMHSSSCTFTVQLVDFQLCKLLPLIRSGCSSHPTSSATVDYLLCLFCCCYKVKLLCEHCQLFVDTLLAFHILFLFRLLWLSQTDVPWNLLQKHIPGRFFNFGIYIFVYILSYIVEEFLCIVCFSMHQLYSSSLLASVSYLKTWK